METKKNETEAKREQIAVVRTTSDELNLFINGMNELRQKKLTCIPCYLVTKFVDFCNVWDLNVMGGALNDNGTQYLYID